MKISPNAHCPCGRPEKFKRCCLRLHRGVPPATPEELMRSRYAAYAAGDTGYIIATTHPDSPYAEVDRKAWQDELKTYCTQTTFEGLDVRNTELGDGGEEGWVTFLARLRRGRQDGSFIERSLFRKHEGRWKYVSGEFMEI